MRPASAAALLLLALPALARDRPYRSAADLRAADTRTLAAGLVRRLREGCEKQKGAPLLGEDAAILMMVPSELLGAILERGFLNRHQTGTGRGLAGAAERFEAEQQLAMMRLPYDRKGRELLPKYGLLDAADSGLGSFPLPARYGDAVVAFKPEVRERATWTYADSLDRSRTAGRFLKGGTSNPVLARSFSFPAGSAGASRCANYCEVQIWGALDWSDVAYAMIPSTAAVPSALLRAGVPVYRWSPGSRPGRTAQYVRGPLVPSGSAAFRSAAGEARAPAPLAGAPGRSLELLASSEGPWSAFKPRLLAALRDPEPVVVLEAAALASGHLEDRDVAAALRVLREDSEARLRGPGDQDPPLDVLEWLDRAETGRLCEPGRVR